MYFNIEVLKPKECFKRYNRVYMWKRFHLSRKAHTLCPRREWAPLDDLRFWVPVGYPALISLDLPLTTLVGVTERRRNILTITQIVQKQQEESLSDYAQQDLSIVTACHEF
jgi:hypothetical protein